MSRAEHTPRGAWPPAVAFVSVELEGAVLNELGVEAAVGAGADVLEEDTYQFVADGFAAFWCLHSFLGIGGEGGKEEQPPDEMYTI